MKNQHLLLALMVLCLFSFCKNGDDDLTPSTNNPINPSEIVTTTINGYVTDENNNPVSNAQIKFASNFAITDENGVFTLRDISTPSRDAYITVEKEDYFHASKRIYPSNNARLNLPFKLLPKNAVGTISNSAGGTVSLSNGAKIFLPPNSVAFNGEVYDGDVVITMQHLAPDDQELFKKMPGDLTGINTSGDLQAIATFGMLAIELNNEFGVPLEMASGAQATLTFPVPSDMMANAPSSIPLWHFDEEAGFWMEEGQASLQGNAYVGEVTHFSFWNCDVPFDLVYVQGRVVNQGGIPISDLLIETTVNSSGLTRIGSTDSDGKFCGLMPKDEALTFEIIAFSNFCPSETLLSVEQGPFSEDTGIGDLIVDLSNITEQQISGSLIDCNGNPVSYGFIKLFFENQTDIVFANNGIFNVIYPPCNFDDLDIIAYDIDNFKVSETLSFEVESNLMTGPIMVCDEDITEFIVYSLDNGAPNLYLNPQFVRTNQSTIISGNQEGSARLISLSFDGLSTGIFDETSVSLPSPYNEDNDITITVSDYGDQGSYITGTFEGTATSNSSGNAQIQGSFRVLNNLPPPQTGCSIPETSFIGDYTLSIVSGGESCFSENPIYSSDAPINLVYVSEFRRQGTFIYLPEFGGFSITVEFVFSCDEVLIPYIETGVGCASNILQLGGFPLENYDSNDDSSFQFNITDMYNDDCCPAVTGNVYKLTKL